MFDHVTPIGWAVLGCAGVMFLLTAVILVVWIAQIRTDRRTRRLHQHWMKETRSGYNA